MLWRHTTVSHISTSEKCSGLRKASSKSSLQLNNAISNWPSELCILMVFHWKHLSDAKVKSPKIVGMWKQLQGCKKSLSRKKTMFQAMSVAYRRHVWRDLLFNSARTPLIHLGRWKVTKDAQKQHQLRKSCSVFLRINLKDMKQIKHVILKRCH